MCAWLAVNFVWLVTGNYSVSNRADSAGIVCVCVGGGGCSHNGKKGLEFLPEVDKCGHFTGQGSRYAVTRQLS